MKPIVPVPTCVVPSEIVTVHWLGLDAPWLWKTALSECRPPRASLTAKVTVESTGAVPAEVAEPVVRLPLKVAVAVALGGLVRSPASEIFDKPCALSEPYPRMYFPVVVETRLPSLSNWVWPSRVNAIDLPSLSCDTR